MFGGEGVEAGSLDWVGGGGVWARIQCHRAICVKLCLLFADPGLRVLRRLDDRLFLGAFANFLSRISQITWIDVITLVMERESLQLLRLDKLCVRVSIDVFRDPYCRSPVSTRAGASLERHDPEELTHIYSHL